MATKSEAFDDIKSVADAPPSYDTVSTPSVQSTGNRPSVLSLLRTKQKRAIVLSRIRDIVSSPNFAPSSTAPIVSACATALPPAVFPHLLQTPNIEGHTALYWAIVNNKREAFSILSAHIPQFSSVCSSDLRLACMAINDHELFTQLNLGNANSPKDEPLRRSLGYPLDEVTLDLVQDEDGLCQNKTIACIRIKEFQKRLRVTQDVGIEFVAWGRIWWLRFCMGHEGRWRVEFGLSQHSFPAQLHFDLVIESHGEKSSAGELGWQYLLPNVIVPLSRRSLFWLPCWPCKARREHSHRVTPAPHIRCSTAFAKLGDWVMDDNTEYVDYEGTLHARVEMTRI